MSQGLPVIASRVTSILEVVSDGGLLADPMDIATWFACLKQISDPSEYRRLSSAALRRAATFSPERTGNALRAAYEAFLAGEGIS